MAKILPNGFIQLDDGTILDPKDPSVRAMCELAALCQPKIVPGGGFRLGGGSRGAQGSPGPQGPQGESGGGGGGGGGIIGWNGMVSGISQIVPPNIFASKKGTGALTAGDNDSGVNIPNPDSYGVPVPAAAIDKFLVVVSYNDSIGSTVFKVWKETTLIDTITVGAGLTGIFSGIGSSTTTAGQRISFSGEGGGEAGLGLNGVDFTASVRVVP